MKYEMIKKKGISFIILPFKHYEQLLEDAETLADLQALKEARAEGGEYFPSELVYSIIDGENPVQAFRKYRKLTQEELASMAGISRAYLAALETGKKQGSIRVFKSLAKALNVDVDSLLVAE